MKGTRALWFVIAAALAGLLIYTDFDLLPAPYNLVLESEHGPRASGTGTAFSVGDGVWLTARHVVNACKAVVFLEDGDGVVGFATRTVHHPTADVSLLFSDLRGPPLRIASAEEEPDRHANGYLFGFPRRTYRSFPAKLVEARILDREAPTEAPFPILIWAEQPKPDRPPDYGGLSGGPVLDGQGRVVGLSVGSDTHLGRVLAAAPELLREMMGRHVRPDMLGRDPGTALPSGEDLRAQGTVRQIFCRAG